MTATVHSSSLIADRFNTETSQPCDLKIFSNSVSDADLYPGEQCIIPNDNIPLGTEFEWIKRGNCPQQADITLAQLSNDVYLSIKKGYGSFRCFTIDELIQNDIKPESLADKASGFQAGLYTNGQQVVLAFAGTNDRHDVMTDILQGMGCNTIQYNQAVALARQVKERFGNKLVITGHSLGGGLASIAALATNIFTVTFNAAGLASNTIKRLHLDPGKVKREARAGGIRSYNEKHDMLTAAQKYLPLAKAIGCSIVVDDIAKKGQLEHDLVAHTMNTTSLSIWKTRPWNKQYV